MVKLGKAFSILVVFTLLILLAPAVVLTGGSVAQGSNGEAVVQEIEATFTFTEDSPGGDWWPFIAGGGPYDIGDIQSPGLTLEQYTRPYVLLQSMLPGCGFREYTTGSGNAAGGLTGTLSLAWLTFRFNQQYDGPGDLYLPDATDFGWMTGRGHIGEDLTFVFIADLDCDDDMTNAVGKGFMVSIEESGIFGETNATDPDTHKVIGDFEVVKTGSDYTWTLHLRDYAPNEVCYKGDVTVYGGVMQEHTDPIHTPLALLNFTQDGPEVTPTIKTTDFEEIAWGKDPVKTVTGGPLGTGGDMDITRNGALYLEVHETENWVRIQATEACKLHINDTNEEPRLDDGSTYGHAYYYLVLAVPDQTLDIGEMFKQDGYTWYPFGMHLEPTECYAGAETFALAHIEIESAAGEATQTSLDLSYGLFPHPKVDSVSPNSGLPGAAMDVTISGKYFLAANGEKSGWHPNSGSVDFGDGINVISYTINNATNPIDNSITASITIDSGASLGARDVNVTSCFGYASGAATGPYKSGHGVFNVVAGFAGHVDLQGRPATDITVRFFAPGTVSGENEDVGMKTCTSTDNNGDFLISGLTPGIYDVAVKGQTSLSNLLRGVDLSVLGTRNFGVLVEGDATGDDYIDGSDFGKLKIAWHSYPGCPAPLSWNPAVDFTRDEYIDGSDFGKLKVNWHEYGDCCGWLGDWVC